LRPITLLVDSELNQVILSNKSIYNVNLHSFDFFRYNVENERYLLTIVFFRNGPSSWHDPLEIIKIVSDVFNVCVKKALLFEKSPKVIECIASNKSVFIENSILSFTISIVVISKFSWILTI